MESTTVMEKNTFIDVTPPRAEPPRRTSSLPPSVRLFGDREDARSSDSSTECSTALHQRQLSTAAKPFCPAAPEGGDFTYQALIVVESVRLALASHRYATRTRTCNTAQGAAIIVWIRNENFDHKEKVLTTAKEHFLRAAETTTSTYVLGYCQRPFLPQPYGFVTQLAPMESESGACWETYRTGFCSFGSACRRRHPPSMMWVHVVLCIEEYEVIDPFTEVPQCGVGGYFETDAHPKDSMQELKEAGGTCTTAGTPASTDSAEQAGLHPDSRDEDFTECSSTVSGL